MPKDDPLEASSQAVADLLERSGHTRQEARALARQAVHLSRTVSRGCGVRRAAPPRPGQVVDHRHEQR